MVYRVLCARDQVAIGDATRVSRKPTPFESRWTLEDLKLIGRPALVERIRDLMRRAGPITFERFMEMALYEPGLGYYASLRAESRGRSGPLADFQTSPQVHPIFGQLVSRELIHIWEALGEPRPFVILELGAGAGELERQIRDGLGESRLSVDLVYHTVEVRRGTPYDADPNPRSERGRVHLVLSNEFFDALPVHRLIRLGDEVREVYVDWGVRGFVEHLGDLSDPILVDLIAHRRGADREGWRGEACGRIDGVLKSVTARIDRGVVLTIDYGYEASDPNVPDGETLLAYYRHQWSDDLLARVGEQDLTSHLDVDELLRAGAQYGLVPAGVTTQGDFLRRLGFDDEARRWAERESTPGRQWQTRFAMGELIDPRGLGRLKVIAQTKGTVPYAVDRAVST